MKATEAVAEAKGQPVKQCVLWSKTGGNVRHFGVADEVTAEIPRDFGSTRVTVRATGVVEITQQNGVGDELNSTHTILADAVRTPDDKVESLEEVVREHFLYAYEKCQQDITKTAEALGVSIKTVYNRLRRYGRHPSDPSPPGAA